MPGRRAAWDQIRSLADAFGELRADYNAAKNNRFRKRLTGVASAGSGADYHYRGQGDYLRMMELSRSFDRNDVVVGQDITRLVDNVLQNGIKLDPETGSEELDRYLLERWGTPQRMDWSTDPDQCHAAGETYPVYGLAPIPGDLDHDGDVDLGLLHLHCQLHRPVVA